MHVVIAAHDFYPDPGSGGTGRYVYETARRLADRGHRMSVITRRRGDRPRRSVVDDVSVYRYDLEIAGQPAPAVLSQLPSAWGVVGDHLDYLSADGRPDLISAQGPVTSLLVDGHLAADVPRIVTFHSPWAAEYRLRTRHRRSAVRRWLNAVGRHRLERFVLDRATGVITLSGYMSDELRQGHGNDIDPVIVPGGVDLGRFSPEAASADRSVEGDPAFLTVRRLVERMGHSLLLEAFAIVVEQYPQARLYIAGDGPQRTRLERLAATLGVDDRTTFLGFVPDRNLPALYAGADVFVLPTTDLEGFGLATLEALASGTPVVATPVGGSVEVLSGLVDDPGLPASDLVPAATAEALADGMARWASRSDRHLKRAGRAGREYVRSRFRWEQTAARVERYYERAVG